MFLNKAIIFWKKKPILSILTLIFAWLAFAYLAKGFYTLAFDSSPSGARDLLERWQEQQYIYLGIYPYRMNPADINAELGRIRSGGYPPWAFLTGFFMFPPISSTLTRFYHVFLNLISLGILSRFAYQLGLPFGRMAAYFFVFTSLAISSNCTTLNNGQYGLIVNAFLIIVYWLLQANKNYLAGLFMGIALVKPNISAPYLLSLVIKRKFKTVILAFVYIISATFAIAHTTRLNFEKVIGSFLNQIKYVADDGVSSINIIMKFGISTEITLVLLTTIGLVLGIVIFQKLQHTSLLTLFACAAVIGRVFTYHRPYDDLMLVFLLLALLTLAFSYPSRLNIIIVSLVGLTLWLPLSIQNLASPYWSIFQNTIWLIALVYLLVNSWERENNADD
ncbi:glycosyltransferase 87 family protein [Microcystis aeruginosa]|nr:glycosyltransferase 87 family protein [Microcystis aeruginosa]